MIQTLKREIDRSLVASLKKIKRDYAFHTVNPVLYESIKEFSLRKGKRIRPLLLILSYKGFAPVQKKISRDIYHASTCMELLHNFMLIHDDIIDRSNLRRGQPTLHRLLRRAAKSNDPDKLGSDLSIIAGDIVYALAIDAFLSIKEAPQRKEQALKYFIKTAVFTAMGEFIDILYSAENIAHIKEKDIFLNYTLKTARYTFECPLVVGAILAGAGREDIDKLSRFGIKVGRAFQIQDDILGLYGSQKSIGKSILSDIAEFKKTLLVCHAYQKLTRKRRAEFMRHFSKDRKTYKDLLALRRILVESDSLRYSLQKIRRLMLDSKTIIENSGLHDKYKKVIWKSLQSLFNESNRIAKANKLDVLIP